MRKNYRFTAVLGAIGVILGALGSHWVKSKVSPELLEAYKTGVLYHMIHVMAMFIALILGDINKLNKPVAAARFFALGIILFSGSLYIMAFAQAFGSSAKFIGPVTPMGGVAFIVGWIYLFLNLKSKDSI